MEGISLGCDCWREIFSWLTFHERIRIRIICKKWNEWITQHKSFWEIDYKLYSLVVKNVKAKTYETIFIQLKALPSRIYTDLPFGILVWYLERTFSIYSKTDYKLLYSSPSSLSSIHISGDYILAKDLDLNFLLMRITLNKQGKINVQIMEYLIPMNEKVYSFEYPYITFFSSSSKIEANLFDVRTGVDLVKQMNITQGCVSNSLTKHYYSLKLMHPNQSFDLFVFRFDNLTKPLFKIFVSYHENFYESSAMMFYFNTYLSKVTSIDCYNTITGKETNIQVSFKQPFYVDDKVIIVREGVIVHDIYMWNSDYTSLKHLTTTDQSSTRPLKCFHSSLPFLAFKEYTSNYSTKITIYSKSRALSFIIKEEEQPDRVIGDTVSKIFSLRNKQGQQYIQIYDFGFLN